MIKAKKRQDLFVLHAFCHPFDSLSFLHKKAVDSKSVVVSSDHGMHAFFAVFWGFFYEVNVITFVLLVIF